MTGCCPATLARRSQGQPTPNEIVGGEGHAVNALTTIVKVRSLMTIRKCASLAALVMLAMVAGPPVLAQDGSVDDPGGFADIEGNPHEDDILFIVNRGVTVGCDLEGPRYCPDDPVTRAQIAAFLARALRLDTTVPYLGVFSDVSEGAWYTPFVEAMGANGLTDTEVSGSYRPDDPMLRSEMAVFLQRAFRLDIPDGISSSSFSDIALDASYLEEVEAVLTAGITRGCSVDPPGYCPQDQVRRDTMAAFLARALRAADLQAVLDYAPGRQIMQSLTTGEDLWNVWICKGANLTRDLLSHLNRRAAPYFEWLSGGRHQIRFRHGADPTPEVSAILSGCGDNSRHVKRVEGTHIFVGSPLGGRIAGLAYQGAFDSRDGKFYRNVWIDARSIYHINVYAHEIGHTLGWPHNLAERGASRPLITGMDVMAMGRELVGTHAHNLFHTGWLDPSELVMHQQGSGEYLLGSPHSDNGRKLLLLPVTADKMIAVGARAREGYDRGIADEGVEVHQIDLCNPWVVPCKGVFLPPGARSDGAVVLDVGESWSANLSVFYQRRGSFVNFELEVVERVGDAYQVRVDATPLTSGFSSIEVGRGICATRLNGIVVCWDWFGFDSSPIGSMEAVSVGDRACGVRVDKAIECWGLDIGGTPPPDGDFMSVSTGGSHTCGLRPDGAVDCWGTDVHGSKIDYPPPGERFTSISTGWGHGCGIREDRTVGCWGRDSYGETLPPPGEFISVSSGGFFSCGLRADQSLQCWGADHDGKATPPTGRFTDVETGWNHACGMRVNGTVECWGFHQDGATAVPGGLFIDFGVGDGRTCGLRPDRTVECWGVNHLERIIPPLEIAH